jgi:cytidine deaminase
MPKATQTRSLTLTPAQKALFEQASQTRLNSYSPYSKHKVGAAIRVKGGRIFGGCNVENSSYGGTVCAERVAVQKAVSELGPIEIEEVMVVTDSPEPWPPCGFCRQVIGEFARPEIAVHSANLQSKIRTTTLAALLPEAFSADYLKK